MDTIIWSIMAIGGGVVFVGAIIALTLKWKNNKDGIDYRSMYTVGISMVPLGIIFMAEEPLFGALFFIPSIILMSVGLKNKDKWKEVVLTPAQKKRKIILAVTAVLVGIIVAFSFVWIKNTKTQNIPSAAGDAVSAVHTQAARELDISTIAIISATEKEWPNSCLGLAQKDELCAQVITPGYEVVIKAEGKQFVYRTNTDGSAVRLEQ